MPILSLSRTTANSKKDSNMAPSNSPSDKKPTTDLLTAAAPKHMTLPVKRFLELRNSRKPVTTTEEPRSDEQNKKNKLNDLKRFAKKLTLGSCTLPFHMSMKDMDALYTANPGAGVSLGRKESTLTYSVNILPSEAAAFRGVLETSELLESIVCYLPPKQILNVQRVAKQWKNVIAGSPSIQEKLFTRRENKEQEIWVLVLRNPPVHGPFSDRPLRVKTLPPPGILAITPVTLNPMLHVSRSWLRPIGVLFPTSMLPTLTRVGFSAWANVLRYNESCVRNMLITDPPCTTARIEYLIVRFGFPESRLQTPKPDYFDRNHPMQDALSVRVSGITVRSSAGLTMHDVLKAAMTGRGKARCTLSNWDYYERRDTTMYEMIDIMMQALGWTSVPESPYMELCMEISTAGSTSIMIATEEDREEANGRVTALE